MGYYKRYRSSRRYKSNYNSRYSSTSSYSGRSGFSTRTKNGYAQYNAGSGWKWTHRRVAEKKMGSSIRIGYEVHHINRNKRDNRPSNLRVLSRSAHRAIHKSNNRY
jgi:hypothetical protein